MKIILFVVFLLLLSTALVTLYFNIGFFIVQPCRQELKGSTIMYWRADFEPSVRSVQQQKAIISNYYNSFKISFNLRAFLVPC